MAKSLLFYVQGIFGKNQVRRIMEQHPSNIFIMTDSISLADVVIWTGGEDINPKIYYESNVSTHYINEMRDRSDLCAVRVCDDKFKIGICRGAQLLNCVPNGGSLWQDVDGHNSGPHVCKDYISSKEVTLNSVHHQMMRPGKDAIIVCGTQVSTQKYGYNNTWKRHDVKKVDPDLIDPEVIWYPKTRSLCFQGHPEYESPETRGYFYELVNRYILLNIGKKEAA